MHVKFEFSARKHLAGNFFYDIHTQKIECINLVLNNEGSLGSSLLLL